MKLKQLFLIGSLSLATALHSAHALASGLMPFILGASSSLDLDRTMESTKLSVEKAGFEIVGVYAPNAETQVLVVTNKQLKELAKLSDNGGFGAIERIALVQKNGKTEVSYTNPEYHWNAYRMKGDIQSVQADMIKALGQQQMFGADKGLAADDLREYHYKFAMPYFDDVDELAKYDSYQQAVTTIEKGLASAKAGVKKIYRVDIPGTEMTVFGVSFTQHAAADANVLKQIDQGEHSHAAHLCYEILVNGKQAIALNGKFRIAINWPSLSMMGEGSFMSISSVPGEITDALEAVANP